jgi:hypothetical protein
MQSRSHRTRDEGSWLSYRSLLVRTRRRRSVVLGGHDYPFAREQQKRTTPLLLSRVPGPRSRSRSSTKGAVPPEPIACSRTPRSRPSSSADVNCSASPSDFLKPVLIAGVGPRLGVEAVPHPDHLRRQRSGWPAVGPADRQSLPTARHQSRRDQVAAGEHLQQRPRGGRESGPRPERAAGPAASAPQPPLALLEAEACVSGDKRAVVAGGVGFKVHGANGDRIS